MDVTRLLPPPENESSATWSNRVFSTDKTRAGRLIEHLDVESSAELIRVGMAVLEEIESLVDGSLPGLFFVPHTAPILAAVAREFHVYHATRRGEDVLREPSSVYDVLRKADSA